MFFICLFDNTAHRICQPIETNITYVCIRPSKHEHTHTHTLTYLHTKKTCKHRYILPYFHTLSHKFPSLCLYIYRNPIQLLVVGEEEKLKIKKKIHSAKTQKGSSIQLCMYICVRMYVFIKRIPLHMIENLHDSH